MKMIFNGNNCFLTVFLTVLTYNVFAQTGFGQSATCNVNAVCDYPWCNQRGGVVLILKKDSVGNYQRSSSGSLVVNERKDGRPYLLAGNHVVDPNQDGVISTTEQQVISTLKFVFNYQSPNCTPSSEASLTYEIIGATLLAHIPHKSDMALLELSSRPPGNFSSELWKS